MTEPKMIKARGNGVKIQLAVWEGKEKQVLCIHGLTANCRCWDLVASPLAPPHRILAMDLRGRGLSDSPPSGYSIENHCKDILALMDDLNLKKPVLMGHSLGAFISLVFAALHPQGVGGLILVDGGGKLRDDQMATVLAGMKPSLDRLGQIFPSIESYLALMKQGPFFQPWSPFIETYFRYEMVEVEGGIRPRIRPEHIQEEVLNLRAVDASQFYSKVSVPVLILRATLGMLAKDDLVLPEEIAEEMVRKIPDARRVDLEGVNHYTILFQPHENRDRIICEFLAAH